MDNEVLTSHDTLTTLAPRTASSLPRTAETTTHATIADRERTGVFTSLVREDGDISGLVAYSIYKQNKLDWLQAFEAIKGRAPDEAELAAYIIGESTPRRLATYRHLAESTLSGNGPDVEGSARAATSRTAAPSGMVTPTMLVAYGIIAVLFVVGLWLAAHYTVSNH